MGFAVGAGANGGVGGDDCADGVHAALSRLGAWTFARNASSVSTFPCGSYRHAATVPTFGGHAVVVAQPSCFVPFHTTAVKCPVSGAKRGVRREPYRGSSAYHACTASEGLPMPMATFSP